MEFVSVRDLRVNTGEVWNLLETEKELVITSNGRPIAVMTGITGASLEPVLAAIRQARGQWAIRKMREDAGSRGLDKLSPEEIKEEIKKSRQERAK